MRYRTIKTFVFSSDFVFELWMSNPPHCKNIIIWKISLTLSPYVPHNPFKFPLSSFVDYTFFRSCGTSRPAPSLEATSHLNEILENVQQPFIVYTVNDFRSEARMWTRTSDDWAVELDSQVKRR